MLISFSAQWLAVTLPVFEFGGELDVSANTQAVGKVAENSSVTQVSVDVLVLCIEIGGRDFQE